MNKRGFTLMEMVIVIFCIGLLFLLTVPRIQKVAGLIGDKTCDAQLKVIDSAILQYMLKYDENPDHLDDLVSEQLIGDHQRTCQNGRGITIVDGEAQLD